ncbi:MULTISPECIES: hypothetical protein [Providencia]|uniref:hypothetical protein n=1 Tax=Providencia TaxID=586 RepID=UPI001BD66E0C|nr:MULTISPECIES: hypothetical protein [Providencia]ELR5072273.1 hypothetical protein [Providencia rettgeri]
MNQIGVLPWAKIIFFLFGMVGVMSSSNAEEKMKTNYIVSFNTNDALCFIKINDMLVIDNVGMTDNSFTTGKTISSYLQNGKNTLSVTMLNNSLTDSDKLTSNMWCSATVKKTIDDKPSFGIKLIVDTNGEIKINPDFYPSKIEFFGDSPRSNNAEKNMIEATKSFVAKDLPEWNWTKGQPVSNADIPQIKNFYESLQNSFKNQNLDEIYKKTEGMWGSLAIEQGSTPQKMWESMPFKRFFNEGYKSVPINWDGFKLNSYMDGRIFRFEKGYGRASPLKIENSNGDFFITTPYLSIIDGKVTVVK